MSKLKVLDLFSGIGGFSLGLERTGGFETVAFCEIEEYPRRVLAKHWPEVPAHTDVRKLRGADVGPVDLICGGYPCQPFSTAGKRRGKEDDRHLWPEFSRLVAELRPTWVIGENVAGHISMGLDDVLSDLEGQGYTCRTFVIPACALGAHHRRDRCWTVAYANGPQRGKVSGTCDGLAFGQNSLSQREEGSGRSESRRYVEQILAHTEGERQSEAGETRCRQSQRSAGASVAHSNVSDAERLRRFEVVASVFGGEASQGATGPFKHSRFPRGWEGWLTEPDVGRVADGVPSRVDRLKALGNAVVPQIPEMIGQAILQAEAAA